MTCMNAKSSDPVHAHCDHNPFLPACSSALRDSEASECCTVLEPLHFGLPRSTWPVALMCVGAVAVRASSDVSFASLSLDDDRELQCRSKAAQC